MRARDYYVPVAIFFLALAGGLLRVTVDVPNAINEINQIIFLLILFATLV